MIATPPRYGAWQDAGRENLWLDYLAENKVRVRIVKSGTNTVVNGTYVFAVADIDVYDASTNKLTSGEYSESIRNVSGLVDNIYYAQAPKVSPDYSGSVSAADVDGSHLVMYGDGRIRRRSNDWKGYNGTGSVNEFYDFAQESGDNAIYGVDPSHQYMWGFFATMAKSDATFIWRGSQCGTRLLGESKGAGSLEVSKVVSGSSTTKPWHIKVEFSGNSAPETQEFDLKGGKTHTLYPIPAGIKYTVTETNPDGFTVTYSGRTGTISDGKTSKCVVTNTLSRGLLLIHKRLAF